MKPVIETVGDGTKTLFDLPFPYLRKEHVYALVGGLPRTFTWINASRLALEPAPASGVPVHIFRETPTAPLHTLANNKVIPAEQYQELALQAIYYAEEHADENALLEPIVVAADAVVAAKEAAEGAAAAAEGSALVASEAEEGSTASAVAALTAKAEAEAAATQAAQTLGAALYETDALMRAVTPADNAKAYVWLDSDPSKLGLHVGKGGVWVRDARDVTALLAEKVGDAQGFRWSGDGDFPQALDANGTELLGFDRSGRAIFLLSPTVQSQILDIIPAPYSGYVVPQAPGGFPSLLAAGGVELLGFDSEGKARFAVSQDVLTQIEMGLDLSGGGGGGASYDPVVAGLVPSPDILLLGDSMSTGTIASSISAALGGRAVSVLQKGGHTAASMSVVMGVNPLTVTIAGNTIPASGGVAVTGKSVNILSSGGSYGGTANVTIGGISGVISSDSSGNWTFTRSAPGSETSVSEGTPAVLSPTLGTANIPATNAYLGRTLVIWLGRNGSKTTRAQRVATTLEPLRQIATKLSPRCKRIIFVTPYNQQQGYESSGSGGYNSIMDLTEEMRRELGPYVVDMRTAAVKNAIYDIGDTPDSTDLANMAADCIPTRYFSDPTHVNSTLQAWQGTFLGNYLRAIGY